MYYFFNKLMEQSFFNYDLRPNFSMNDYFVGTSNNEAYNLLINTKRKRMFPNIWTAISFFFMKLINLDNLSYILF